MIGVAFFDDVDYNLFLVSQLNFKLKVFYGWRCSQIHANFALSRYLSPRYTFAKISSE